MPLGIFSVAVAGIGVIFVGLAAAGAVIIIIIAFGMGRNIIAVFVVFRNVGLPVEAFAAEALATFTPPAATIAAVGIMNLMAASVPPPAGEEHLQGVGYLLRVPVQLPGSTYPGLLFI